MFLRTVFESENPVITAVANRYLSDKSHTRVLDVWLNGKDGSGGKKLKKSVQEGRDATVDWVIDAAAGLCAKEASLITDKASEGPFKKEAASLRVPAKSLTVEKVKEFRASHLEDMYDRTLPKLQKILTAVVAKDKKDLKPGSRNPDHVCLNLYFLL